MMLPILIFAFFLGTLGLVMGTLFFLVETPMAQRKLRTRLASVQQAAPHREERGELFKKDLFSGYPALNRILRLTPGVSRLQLFLDQAAIPMELGTFVLIAVALPSFVFLAGMIVEAQMLYCVAASVAVAVLPFGYASIRRNRRLKKFEEQFPEAIDLLARSIRAGHAFPSGLEMAGREFPDPLGEEFRMVYRQQNLGLPLRDALGNMLLRMPSPDLRILISALQIQREAGGNLGEILDSLSSVIRERFKLRRQVRILTAEGRLSKYVLSALPILTVLGLSAFNSGYLTPLITDPRGQVAIAAAVVMQIIGYVVLDRITRIKI